MPEKYVPQKQCAFKKSHLVVQSRSLLPYAAPTPNIWTFPHTIFAQRIFFQLPVQASQTSNRGPVNDAGGEPLSLGHSDRGFIHALGFFLPLLGMGVSVLQSEEDRVRVRPKFGSWAEIQSKCGQFNANFGLISDLTLT